MGEPLSIQHGELEHLLDLIRESARSQDQGGLDRLLGRIAEEPKALLAKNPLFEREIERVNSLKAAHEFNRQYGSLIVRDQKGFGILAMNTLECAAADLLVRLYALRGVPPDWLPGTWEEQEPLLEKAFLAFLYEREVPDAEHGRNFGPHKRGRGALGKVLEETFEDLFERFGHPPIWREVVDHLPVGEGQVIQEIDEDLNVWWWSNGREKKTTPKSLQNMLTEIRKTYKKNHP